MSRPRSGEIRPAAPADAVSIDTANAAFGPPKMSSGRLYILTLNAATANQLSEIPAAPHDAAGANGIAAVARPSADAATHTRSRAAAGATPRSIHRRESAPPAKPP